MPILEFIQFKSGFLSQMVAIVDFIQWKASYLIMSPQTDKVTAKNTV